VVTSGKLIVGVDNALPTTTTLITTANGVLDLNGQNQTVGRLTNTVDQASNTSATNNGFITNSGTTVKTLSVGNGSSGNATYRGVVQHNVALTKTGVDVQTLTNANTYVGPTTINDGVLEVAGSLTGTSKVDINAGGTLSGAATLANPLTTALSAGPINVNNGGTFSPGVAGATAGVGALGTFNATGGLTTSNGATLKIDLQTPTSIGVPGGLNDRIDVTGSISLAGTTAITLTLTGGYNPALGDLFFIALNDGGDSITGSPANFSVADIGGVAWQVFTGANAASGFTTGGNDIAILAVVPEPNALSMLVGSLGMALGLQRFRRRRRES
jgi:autotransporter-associated beta strand protein